MENLAYIPIWLSVLLHQSESTKSQTNSRLICSPNSTKLWWSKRKAQMLTLFEHGSDNRFETMIFQSWHHIWLEKAINPVDAFSSSANRSVLKERNIKRRIEVRIQTITAGSLRRHAEWMVQRLCWIPIELVEIGLWIWIWGTAIYGFLTYTSSAHPWFQCWTHGRIASFQPCIQSQTTRICFSLVSNRLNYSISPGYDPQPRPRLLPIWIRFRRERTRVVHPPGALLKPV